MSAPDRKPAAVPVRRSVDTFAVLICALLSFVWGLQQTALKAVASDISPMLQVGLRSGIAAALLWVFNRVFLKEVWRRDLPLKDMFLVGLGFAGEFFFVSEALRLTSASHVSVLLYTAPFFSAIGLALKLPEERLSGKQWGGLILAFTGVAVAFLVPPLLEGINPENSLWLLGDLLGLCSGLAWGATIVALRTNAVNDAPPGQMLFIQLVVGSVLLTLYAVLSGQQTVHFTELSLWSMAFQTLIVSFVSYLVWMFMLKRYFASQLGVLVFMTPIFGVGLSVLLLNETVGLPFYIGALLVMGALFLVKAKK